MSEQMFNFDCALTAEAENAAGELKTLQKIMPAELFASIDNAQAARILTLSSSLSSCCSPLTAQVSGKMIRVYFRSSADAVKAVKFSFASAQVFVSSEPVVLNGESGDLVVELFTLEEDASAAALYSLDDLKAATGTGDPDFAELYSRLNWGAMGSRKLNCVVNSMNRALDVQGASRIKVSIEAADNGLNRMLVAAPNATGCRCFFQKIADVFAVLGLKLQRGGWYNFSKSAGMEALKYQAVDCGYFYFAGSQDSWSALESAVKSLFWSDSCDLYYSELAVRRHFAVEDVNILRSAAEFLHSQFSFIDAASYAPAEIARLICANFSLADLAVKYFYAKFAPCGQCGCKDEKRAALAEAIARVNSGIKVKDILTRNIFNGILCFIDNTVKTNFFVADKGALSFRLLPGFMDFFAGFSPAYLKAFPADRPFGVFFFFRSKAAGYQVRFSEIARGGWRTVIPRPGSNDLEKYDFFNAASKEYFKEVYVLAHTQHMKNKDIYEGGSKLITILDSFCAGPNFKPLLWEVQKAVTDAFVTLINYDEDGKLKNKQVLDLLGGKEIIEIGPDENMFDTMIQYMGDYAVNAGYTLGSGLISGKPDCGINHKEHGVTSFGVYQYLLRTMKELNIDPDNDEYTLKISGGPFGDVAGNMTKLLLQKTEDGSYLHKNMKITAITDGPAALYDPAGIDRDALSKLVLTANLDAFDASTLKGEGAYIIYSRPITENDVEVHKEITVENGKIVEKKISRDEFMRLFQGNLYRYADILIPCGGRPSTINADNYMNYTNADGNGERAVVEGANSFLTPEARIKLQETGILNIRDASSNKCGVITSSYEIMSGLMLAPEEFKQVKSVLIPQVKTKLAAAARREANWLYEQRKATGKFMTDLSDELSRHINAKNDEVFALLGENPELVTDEILLAHLPEIFADQYRDRLSRIPKEYRQAIASVELATRIVYRSMTSPNGLKGEVALAIESI